MQNEDSLPQYFVWFFEKIFYSLDIIPHHLESKWLEFRELLINKPINIEKIKLYVNNMYNLSFFDYKIENELKNNKISLLQRTESKKSILTVPLGGIKEINEDYYFDEKKKIDDNNRIKIASSQIINYLNENNINSSSSKQKLIKKIFKNEENQNNISPLVNRYKPSIFSKDQNIFNTAIIKEKDNNVLYKENISKISNKYDLTNLLITCEEFKNIFKKNSENMKHLNDNVMDAESTMLYENISPIYSPTRGLNSIPALKRFSLYLQDPMGNSRKNN